MTVINRWFPAGLDAIMSKLIDLESDTLVLTLVNDLYTYSSGNTTLADIPAGRRLGSHATLAGTRTLASGVLTTDTATTTISAVPTDPRSVAGVILATDGATDADRRLLHLWQRNGDTTEVFVTTNGGGIDVEFAGGTILTILG